MPKKVSNWTVEEIQMLRQLKQNQIRNNQVDWSKIADALNVRFKNHRRTSKRCRDKYINSIKVQRCGQADQNWSQEETELLRKLYEQYGPSWSYFSSQLTRRSENSIKNKFNVSLRRFSKLLNIYQGKMFKQWKKSISSQMLLAMLDFSNQIKKTIQRLRLTVNNNSKLFQFRSKILQFCFKGQNVPEQEACQLVLNIKQLNSKIRCFGVFKVKNRKSYKCTERTLQCVSQFDKVVVQEFSKKQKNQQRENVQQINYQQQGQKQSEFPFTQDMIKMQPANYAPIFFGGPGLVKMQETAKLQPIICIPIYFRASDLM